MYLKKTKVSDLQDGQEFSRDALGGSVRAVRRPYGVYCEYTSQDGSVRRLQYPDGHSDLWLNNHETVFTLHDMVPDYRRESWNLILQVDPQASYDFNPHSGEWFINFSKPLVWEGDSYSAMTRYDEIHTTATTWQFELVFDGSRHWQYQDGRMVKLDPKLAAKIGFTEINDRGVALNLEDC